MNIIGGDYGDNAIAVLHKNWSGQLEKLIIPTTLFGKPHIITASQISNVETLTDENKVALLGACGWGIAGTLIAGPIGAIVGGILGGRKAVITALVTVANGKRFLATCSTDEFKILVSAAVTPARNTENLTKQRLPDKADFSFLDPTPVTSDTFSLYRCSECNQEMRVSDAHKGMVVACPICNTNIQIPR